MDLIQKDVLPDSRAKEGRGAVPGPFGFWVPIYCANCGLPGGRVPEENMTFAFWLCRECFEKHGEITNMLAMPDERFWEQVKQEQLSTYGRLLEEHELQAIVAADASPLATLIKQGRLITPGG